MKKHELHTLIATLRMIGFKSDPVRSISQLAYLELPNTYYKKDCIVEIVDHAGYLQLWDKDIGYDHQLKLSKVPLGKNTVKDLHKQIKLLQG